MTVLLPLTAFFLSGAIFVLLELLRAPRGFEDATGFHAVNPTPTKKEAPATSPASCPQDPAVSSLATSLPCHSVARQSEVE
jgi:hypothetical protein